MKTLRYSTQYKKDFKRYRNNPSKLAKLLEVFRMLEKEIELPAKYRAHMLKGDYLGCMECHIESDFLLIWLDAEADIIEILRLGSHSELFKILNICHSPFSKILSCIIFFFQIIQSDIKF